MIYTTRAYLVLVLVRLYFALSPSYIHPDENFQGPEVIAGEIYGYPNHLTWEFSSSTPVRSVFPLWPVYGVPMVVLKWLWTETSSREVPPKVVYYLLRGVMFISSFVLEDWAIYELVPSPRHRRIAIVLVASSYVTWTYQTHTFSNSVETIVVLWSLVLIQWIISAKDRSSLFASGLLGFLAVFGTFNRITFPAFLLLPGVWLFPHFRRKPLTLLCILLSASLTLLAAIQADTNFHNPNSTISTLFNSPILAPYHSLLYNTSHANLAQHGLHPYYQHILINLPLLMGPAIPLLFTSGFNARLISGISGLLILSTIPHQEPRFLLPIIPLLLSSIRLPFSARLNRIFTVSWVLFNVIMGLLMGRYHQAGVVPMQLHLSQDLPALTHPLTAPTQILWWKTYSPPVWLLNTPRSTFNTTDLMGAPAPSVLAAIDAAVGECPASRSKVDNRRDAVLVAPWARLELDGWTKDEKSGLQWELLRHVGRHIGLDDLDFAEDGVWSTLNRVIGRRGLRAWRIRRACR